MGPTSQHAPLLWQSGREVSEPLEEGGKERGLRTELLALRCLQRPSGDTDDVTSGSRAGLGAAQGQGPPLSIFEWGPGWAGTGWR